MCHKVFPSIAFVAFTFFVTVDGDSRDEVDRCHYSPRRVREAWKPSEEGEFNVKFFVPPHRWGHHEKDVPLTLGLEWGYVEQPNTLRKTRYILEPSRRAAAGPGFPSKMTRLPHESLLIGWNTLPLTWQITSGNISTLNIGNFKTEVNIGPHDEVNVTVEQMTSFLNCDHREGGDRFYVFNSSFLTHKIVPFYWEQNGDQRIVIANASFLSICTHLGGRNLTPCRKRHDPRHPQLYWHLKRGCPPPVWREFEEGDPSSAIFIHGFNIDLEEEEDYLVMRGNWSLLELDVKYTRREEEEGDWAGIRTSYQRSVDVVYEDVFPSEDVENATTALPNTTAVAITTPTAECPFCSPDIYLALAGVIFLLVVIGLGVGIGFCPSSENKGRNRLKEREEQRWEFRRLLEQLESEYNNYEEQKVEETRL